jgi:fimbrial isopeptide formation D2 family protein/LPXTG-motif cell wall-anchored protein
MAGAEGGTTGENTTTETETATETTTYPGSITISNSENNTMVENQKFNVYRIFDLTLSGESNVTTDSETTTTYSNYAYSLNEKWTPFFFDTDTKNLTTEGSKYLTLVTSETADTTTARVSYNGKEYLININDQGTSSNIVDFTKAALAYAVKVDADGSGTAAKDATSVTISNLPLGYYLVYPVGAAQTTANSPICSLNTTNTSMNVELKSSYPSIDKKMTKVGDSTDVDGTVQVGDTVTYTITGTVPDTTGYTKYTYKVSDTMSEGLTFGTGSTVNVQFGTGTANTISATTDANANPKLTVEDNGFVLEYDMVAYLKANPTIQAGDTITITYSATVNQDAVDDSISNHAKLTYSNDPTSGSTSTKDSTEIIVDVYTLSINVNKFTGSGENTTKLSNAVFALYKEVEGVKKYYKADSKGVVSWVGNVTDPATYEGITKVVTNGDGEGSFDGLAAGTYHLEEVTAPSGYNKLANPITIVLDATANTETGSLEELTATVDNEEVTAQDEDNSLNTYLDDTTKTLTVGVANQTGNILPSTGGIGTTIFFVAGGILVAGAMILLIARWRMKLEE